MLKEKFLLHPPFESGDERDPLGLTGTISVRWKIINPNHGLVDVIFAQFNRISCRLGAAVCFRNFRTFFFGPVTISDKWRMCTFIRRVSESYTQRQYHFSVGQICERRWCTCCNCLHLVDGYLRLKIVITPTKKKKWLDNRRLFRPNWMICWPTISIS